MLAPSENRDIVRDREIQEIARMKQLIKDKKIEIRSLEDRIRFTEMELNDDLLDITPPSR